MPRPCALDDVVEPGIFRLPSELLTDLLRTGDKHRWIAGAPWALFDRNRMTGNPACRVNDLPNAETDAIADVVDKLVPVFQRLEGEQVGARQILDVDVVADAGTVGGGVVPSEDLDALTTAEGNVED